MIEENDPRNDRNLSFPKANTSSSNSSTSTGKQETCGTMEDGIDFGVQEKSNRPRSASEPLPYYDDSLNKELQKLASLYEIRSCYINRLWNLHKYKVVVLCDDSGSMTNPVNGSNGRTRWDALRDGVKIIVSICCLFDKSGIDIHFLNRTEAYKIKDPNEIDKLFSQPLTGYTNLVHSVREIFKSPATNHNCDRKLLLFIATDGYPTDDDGEPNSEEFKKVMETERNSQTTHISFLACTDDQKCIKYLNEFDKTLKNVDVTADYQIEKAKIQEKKGRNFPFSYGDYVAKALLGAIDPEIDELDGIDKIDD